MPGGRAPSYGGGVRRWTPEEANDALGWVARCVDEVRAARAALRERRAELSKRFRSNGHAAADEREPIRRALERLMAEGIVLRDPDKGLVDFPAVSSGGRQYWLCWVVGEPEVAWWHWPHEGFAGRRPLSSPPE